ncbi:Predicted kinase (fragment) [Candidatus Terasakiella magnetica]
MLEDMKIEYGVEIHHDGDLPARSGLGSSSSFTVGLINALNAQAGRMVSKDRLAREAIRIEQDVIQENVGSQDQIWAAYGGMNHIEFSRDGGFAVRPVIMPAERRDHMLGSLMLFFTGLSRYAHKVAGDKIANLDSHESHVRAIMAMTDEGLDILSNHDRALDDLGRLLHESWMVKRELASSVTTPEVDAIYQAAMEGGALGGKLLGAGGGGFILFYVEPGKQQAVRDKLAGLVEVHFKIDADGSRIVVYEPEL